jgi:hypothetical protein
MELKPCTSGDHGGLMLLAVLLDSVKTSLRRRYL